MKYSGTMAGLIALSIAVLVGTTFASNADPGKMGGKTAPIKKAPLDTGRIEGKTGHLVAPELSIHWVSPAFVNPAGTARPLPGESFSVSVMVANTGDAEARYSVAHLGPSSRLVLYGRELRLAPGGNETHTLSVRLEKDMIRGSNYAGSIVLVKRNADSRDAMLDQLWKDGNADDNAKQFTVPVDTRKYTVEAELTNIYVSDDCDSGNEPGEWQARFEILLSGTPLRSTNDLTSRTLIKDKDAISIWGSPGGDTTDVRSARNYPFRSRRIMLQHVHWNAHLTLAMPASEDDSPLASGCWHKPFESLGPDRWLARRGEWAEFPMTNNISNLRPTVRIMVRPEG